VLTGDNNNPNVGRTKIDEMSASSLRPYLFVFQSEYSLQEVPAPFPRCFLGISLPLSECLGRVVRQQVVGTKKVLQVNRALLVLSERLNAGSRVRCLLKVLPNLCSDNWSGSVTAFKVLKLGLAFWLRILSALMPASRSPRQRT